jgi:hypothetical protein
MAFMIVNFLFKERCHMAMTNTWINDFVRKKLIKLDHFDNMFIPRS